MTMLAEIQIAEPVVVEYQPTVQDKIQRILYRLEHGENLTHGRMKSYGNYCVLGLFADESGMGHWDPGTDAYKIEGTLYCGNLSESISTYYGLTSETGVFKVLDIPEPILKQLKQKMSGHLGLLSSLSIINDELIIKGYQPNQILADIIRSGIIFKEQ